MFLKQRVLWGICLLFLIGTGGVLAQENSLSGDTVIHPVVTDLLPDSLLYAATDTIRTDSLTALSDTVPGKKGLLVAPVIYQAKDSIVLSGSMAYLYGQGDVKYQQIQLQAEIIEIDMDSSLVYATFGVDTTGMEFGYPLFVDGEQQIEAKSMHHNFKTEMSYAKEVLTQQGEGFLTAGITKKMPDDAMNMIDGMYTTCDEHDHPHFYIRMTKAKARPGKNIVTGPAYLVIEDVPLYLLGLPFAFFPFTSTYSSGIIMPTYGDEMTQGFFLRDGGYYFALSDYVDLAATGEIYTKGSWGFAARSTYRKRYKYSGNFNGSYQVTKWGDKDMPDYQLSKAFKINWTHTQDAKANPYRTFSANVNFSTSQYDHNNIKQQSTLDATQNNKGSSVSISQRFPDNPLSVSATMNINQRSQDSSLAVTLPDITLTMSRIFPLKRKNAVGKERWYEKISMSYSGYLRNSLTSKENDFFEKSLVKDWQNAMQHSIPISATYTAFGYLNISPSVQYQERWYTNKIYQEYDTARHQLAPIDTTYGFYRVYNYNASISASTTLYGMYEFWPVFRKFVKTVRHRMEPSVSFSATPDFGTPGYGYHLPYAYTNAEGQTVTGVYSPYQHQLFGVPGRGKQGNISFGLDNNIEAKIASTKDSSGVAKISLIDNLSFRMGYNLAADSFQWSDLTVGLRLKLTKSYTLNLTGVFDTYTYDYNETTRAVTRVNVPRWQAGKGIGRLRSTSSSFSYTFNNNTFKKLFGGKDDSSGERKNASRSPEDMQDADEWDESEERPEEETPAMGTRLRKAKTARFGDYDDDGYYNATIPWSLSFSYNLGLGYNTQAFDPEKMEYDYRLTHALSFNGNIQPTKFWRINFNASYDFDLKKISYMTCNISRDLHCFQMSASVIPVGYRKSYTFSIAVSSSLLKDLKYNQSSSFRSGQAWY
ncbi:MAG: LPS-assembly protein LptD [Tannerella sp.]|jgi:hypothetical protein|nr:LPS-assembly protein LptD [Tannerella sp.]